MKNYATYSLPFIWKFSGERYKPDTLWTPNPNQFFRRSTDHPPSQLRRSFSPPDPQSTQETYSASAREVLYSSAVHRHALSQQAETSTADLVAHLCSCQVNKQHKTILTLLERTDFTQKQADALVEWALYKVLPREMAKLPIIKLLFTAYCRVQEKARGKPLLPLFSPIYPHFPPALIKDVGCIVLNIAFAACTEPEFVEKALLNFPETYVLTDSFIPGHLIALTDKESDERADFERKVADAHSRHQRRDIWELKRLYALIPEEVASHLLENYPDENLTDILDELLRKPKPSIDYFNRVKARLNKHKLPWKLAQGIKIHLACTNISIDNVLVLPHKIGIVDFEAFMEIFDGFKHQSKHKEKIHFAAKIEQELYDTFGYARIFELISNGYDSDGVKKVLMRPKSTR